MTEKIKGIWMPPHYKFYQKPDEYRQALRVIVESLDEADLPYFIYGGLLLGWCRDAEFISWDNDIDIAIRDQDLDKFERVVDIIRDKGFKINPYYDGRDSIVSFEQGPYRLGPLVDKDRCRIYVVDGVKEVIINSGPRSCYFKPFDIKVEINVFYKINNSYYWIIEDPTEPKITTYVLPAANIDNLTTFLYDNKNYSIPSNPEQILELHFGKGWAIPKSDDSTCNHMYENKQGIVLK